MEEVDEIVNEFIVESLEGLDRLDQALVFLEESPNDKETLTEVFRIFHTIKGTCGFLGFENLEKVAHRGENLLSQLRDGVLEMDDQIANAMLATVDAIRSMIDAIETTGEEGSPDYTDLLSEVERLTAGETGAAAADADAESAADAETTDADESQNDGPVFLDELPPQEPTEAAAETASADDATEAETATAEAETSAEAERLGDILVNDGAAKRDDVEIAAAEQSLGDGRKIGNILVDEGRAEPAEVEKAATKQRSSTAESTIRVDVGLLNQLMNLVGELVLSRNQIVQLVESGGYRDFGSPAQRLSLITTELQEGVMKTRMQPIGNVWGKLPRVVRDLSRQFGKEIRLEMEGKETELDRTILEAIKDPLTHMVRNTVDHGVEDPDERLAKGKPREGVLRLRANHEGGQVIIEITDDGAGIDPDVIRAKAVEKELISSEAAARMGDNEAIQMVFMAGFSTAKKVTNVSGRGVGMDVVRTNIERIGGSVEIKSERGAGTTFKVKIPLTLAIIPALIVRSEGNRYAIPQASLLELVRLDGNHTTNRIEEIHGAPVYRLRGDLLPLVFLKRELRSEHEVKISDDETYNIVVLQADDQQFGLVVGEIDDTEEIVVKPLGREVQNIPFFSGATIMGDGSVALILDVLGLATEAHILSAGSRKSDAPAEMEETASTGGQVSDRALLLVRVNNEVQVAVPLDDVDRLEEFASDEVEQSEHQPVVQYREGVMPLLDIAEVVGESVPHYEDRDRVSIIVCSRNEESVGIVVERVLDIVADAKLVPGATPGTTTAVIDGKVTDIVELTTAIDRLMPAPYSPTYAEV